MQFEKYRVCSFTGPSFKLYPKTSKIVSFLSSTLLDLITGVVGFIACRRGLNTHPLLTEAPGSGIYCTKLHEFWNKISVEK